MRILNNDFTVLRAINAMVQECAGDNVTVITNATDEHKNIQVSALAIDSTA